MQPSQFASFREFYPYYLQQHTNSTSRRLHVGGTLLAVAAALSAVVTGRWRWLLAVPFAGYLPAWIGHVLFARNLPAGARQPSLIRKRRRDNAGIPKPGSKTGVELRDPAREVS